MKQSEALDILKMGHNVLLTGFAGSGKTFLLNKYIEYLQNNGVIVGVTASTGIAATHINGRTIHSWAGMGINKKMSKSEIKNILQKEKLARRLENASVLVIDEISMLSHRQFDLVDQICRVAKKNDLPFGGMQLILSGDFFQLPPVNDMNDRDGTRDEFITQSKVWGELNLKICYLEEQHRQSDKVFLEILNDIRANKVSKKTINTLRSRLNKGVVTKIVPTKLNTHKRKAELINQQELAKIDSESAEYEMWSEGPEGLVNGLKKSCLAPEVLTLKLGAVVIFIKNNFNQEYVNGTMGVVVGFDEESSFPIVETNKGKTIIANRETWTIDEDDGTSLAKISQVPLCLAWAITIHKSQGMSLEAAEIDLSEAFEFGQGYVALSRVSTLEGIRLTGLGKEALRVDEKIVELDKDFMKESEKVSRDLNKMTNKQMLNKQKDFIDRIRPLEEEYFDGDKEFTIDDIPF
ncbi:MAG: PIF1 family DEAD/DEAH box helicase [Patescibacteria group bacterium]|jgi:ATP-dependent exoDNAse (exonuclease V) alpha subunit